MTRIQQWTVNYVREEAIRSFFYDKEKYEFKNFDVEELESGRVYVFIEVGLKGDEGSLAILVRDQARFFIGKRGAISYYDKKGVRRTARRLSVSSIAYDQKYGREKRK